MERNVKIDDTLDERVADACDTVEELLKEYLHANPDTDDVPCLHNDLDYSGSVHEIVDGEVPIYTKEIEDTWYLYSNKLEEAYENAGVGENPRENNGMTAIYFYIHQEVCEWYEREDAGLFGEWESDKELD